MSELAAKTMLLIINPAAGQGSFVPYFFEVVDRFTKGGFAVTAHPTSGPREAYQIALERAYAFDYLVCTGGDGTLNEVVNALMQLDRRPLLGYIPSGSVNDFAATHGLSSDPVLGADTVMSGNIVPVDVGRFQDGFFTYVAAFGLFADVSYDTPQNLKNMFGQTAYFLEGVKKLGNINHHHCRVELEGEVIEDDFILGMISNSRSVGGFPLPGEVDACLDDGLFDLLLLRKIQSMETLGSVISAMLGGKGILDPSFVLRKVRKARFVGERPLGWSVDGEFGGSLKVVEVAVCQKAIEIIVPKPNDKKKRTRAKKPAN
ncbi:MAG: YegS/Rv2252/BmrU family lipid kinase [Oscillospiraceae bacterium]|nr:YegS/Rv2252/BmrU family lipid kinase [Oscillospiraceae bacterium]